MAERNEETIKEPSSIELALERTILCARTNADVLGQNSDLVDHFRLHHLQIFSVGAAKSPSTSRRHWTTPVRGIDDLNRIVLTHDSDNPVPGVQERSAKMVPWDPPLSLVGVVAALVSLLGLVALVAVLFRM